MSSAEDFHQLDLRSHVLSKIDCDQAHHSPSPLNPIAQQKAQKNSSHSRDELQLQHMKLPLKLPQRRKFITLAEANSASYGLNFHENLASHSDKGSSGLQKALDLAMAEGNANQVELPTIAQTKEEGFHEDSEMTTTKKKLLVQLGENSGAIVDSQLKNQRFESGFHGSSNPSRTCRFCGREFPSGRALGGHMRVHGALLFADTSTNMVEQERRIHGELETLGSADHIVSYGTQAEEMKPGSFTSSSSSQMNSGRPNQTNKLDRPGQEDDDEEEQGEGEGKKVSRMVDLSSFECTSLVSKPGEEFLGYGDASSELLTGKRKPASALYELRRNPKPNQRFFRDQELSISNAIWPASYMSSSSAARRSRSPSPEHAHPCSECGKVFLSWKALFGHMRCHPERDWRGIQPPERGLELDCTLRSIAPKASYAEISFADNITNCGSVVSVVLNKEETTAEVQQQVLDKSTAMVVAKEASSSLTRKGVGSCLVDIESRQRDVPTQGKDNTQGLSFKKATKQNSTKGASDYVVHSSKEATDDRSPSWPTGKRSKRTRIAHSQYEPSLTSETTSNEPRLCQHTPQLDDQEDLDMANCLVLLSNAGNSKQEVDRVPWEVAEKSAFLHQGKKRRVSCKGVYSQRASKDGAGLAQTLGEVYTHERGDIGDRVAGDDGDYDEVGNKVNAIPAGGVKKAENHGSLAAPRNNSGVKYQCLTCKKCFNSHQALGGHRASHKKMKGCFAQTKNLAKEAPESSEENVTDDDFGIEHFRWQARATHGGEAPSQEDEERAVAYIDRTPKSSSKKKIKGHECSICHRIFATGQALGGHKRCHWNGERFVADTASVASSNNKQPSSEAKSESWVCKDDGVKLAKEDAIDLNLPAPLDEDDDATFELPEQVMYGGRPPKEGQAVSSLMDYSGARRKLNDVSEDWMVKDLLGGNRGSSFLQETREIEARCRFDRTPPVWNQKWDNAAGTQIPQVCSLQPL